MDPELAPCLQTAASGSEEARCQAEAPGGLELRECPVFRVYQVVLRLRVGFPVALVPLGGSHRVVG